MELKATDFRVALVAKRQGDHHGGKPDYWVYAGSQLVGRMYLTHLTGSSDNWFWGINGLTVDLSVGAVMHGHASGLNDAKAKLRAGFDEWLGVGAGDAEGPGLNIRRSPPNSRQCSRFRKREN